MIISSNSMISGESKGSSPLIANLAFRKGGKTQKALIAYPKICNPRILEGSHLSLGRLVGSGCSNHKQNEASFGHFNSN